MTSPNRARRQTTFSVTELCAVVSEVLDEALGTVWVQGEIGRLSLPRSGHAYFNLKDDRCQVRCVAFRSTRSRLSFELGEGTEILLRGRPSLYADRGDFQIIVDYAEPLGRGSLQAEFERLKQKLEAEGLFAPERKQKLPFLPQCVAVVTSPSGAAIQDFLSILGRRNPSVLVRIIPSNVQGRNAGEELARGVELADQWAKADVIVLTRGGGSAEDLACFNDETLARAIVACRTPIVSAVGHEIDFTIADFVADERAPTPSAAAERLAPVRDELLLNVASLRRRLENVVGSTLDRLNTTIEDIARRLRLRSPRRRVADGLLRLDELERRLDRSVGAQIRTQATRLQHARRSLLRPGPEPHLQRAQGRLETMHRNLAQLMTRRLERNRNSFSAAADALRKLSPLSVLQRGFAVCFKDGVVITDSEALQPGDAIEVRLARGEIGAVVRSPRAETQLDETDD